MKKIQKVERICRGCEKKFYVYPKQIEIGEGNYCSRQCRKTITIKNCLICGKEFKVYQYQIKLGIAKFCSYKCMGIGRRGRHFSPKTEFKGEPKIDIECKYCHKIFQNYKSQNKKFCSKECAIKASFGRKPPNTGIKGYSNRGTFKNGHKPMENAVGEKHYLWKGSNAGYWALHGWIYRQLGQPTKCEHCGKDGLTGKKIHWANKDHKYKRNIKDWIRLCPSCHKKYDIANHLCNIGSRGGSIKNKI
jgi:hypothetical protein